MMRATSETMINIHTIYRLIFRYFRPKRMRTFWKRFGLTPHTRVLDVGGFEFNWLLLPELPQLTIINLSTPSERHPGVTWLVADGRYLPFKDKTFEIVYSNSVIEHLSNRENQHLFASECRRVGAHYYVQTPNKWFPIEPHLLAPFVHWLPKPAQRRLLRHFTIWGLLTKPSQQRCDELLEEICLLDDQALRRLFPDAEIWRERMLGLTKSLMAAMNE
jgi:SAM-dependent methyltransferase